MTPGLSLSFLAPLVVLAVAGFALTRPAARPAALPKLAEQAAMGAMGLVAAGLLQSLILGPVTLSLGQGPAALGLRSDLVALTLAVLVAFIGWVVVRYSRTYLDGEAREGAYYARLLAVLASVLLFVQSGSLLMLVLTSVAIGRGLKWLLLFYPDRPEAQRASTKFALVWHCGDVVLLAAMLVVITRYGTGDLARLAEAAQTSGLGLSGHVAVGLVALAAMLKTATFPVHGWLTEVMEAPTPVSALLHAGIINSGGVLLIKTAALVHLSPGAMAALVMVGGLTALFGAVVMLTQSAVKTSLAWSTVAQMGFMLMQCGLGLWALALLHIVAHSLYKAHAFLSSGGAVAAVAAIRRPGPVAVPAPGAVLKAFGIAILLYGTMAMAFIAIFGTKTPQEVALGAILIFGVAYLVAQGLADAAPFELTRKTTQTAGAAALAYFTLQLLSTALWKPMLPPTPVAGPLEWALILLALVSFGVVAFAQALFPLWAHHPAMAPLRVHLANGLYLNALLDRAIGGFRQTKAAK